jgi:protein gp37
MTKIEWTDLTWNPSTGCEKISAGCLNCYAERMHKRLRGMGKEKYQSDFDKPVMWAKELKREFGKKPKKIFVNSMSDLFHPLIEDFFVYEILKVMERNPQHIFQILTKRPERVSRVQWPENVWFGVTVENKKELHRIDELRRIPCKIKFVSFEPLLEDLGVIDLFGIDWVIVGAETGPGARYMSIDWARQIMLLALFSDEIPFFFKKVSKGDFCPIDLNIRQFPGGSNA